MTPVTKNNITEFSYRNGKHRLKSIRKMLLYIMAAQTAVTVCAAFISGFAELQPPVYLQLFIIEVLAYLLPLSMYAKENRILTVTEARERFGFKRCGAAPLVLAAIMGYGCQFAMILVDLPISMWSISGGDVIPSSPIELAAAIAVIAVIPAIFEEFLMRGIVYGVMAEFNTLAAAVFTTIMFALLHGNLAGIPGYLLLGAILIFVLQRTGSLYACMLLHLTNNVAAVLLSYFSSYLMEVPFVTIVLFITGIAAAIAAFGMLSVISKPRVRIKRIKTSELLGQSFINIPIIFCIFMAVLMLYMQIY